MGASSGERKMTGGSGQQWGAQSQTNVPPYNQAMGMVCILCLPRFLILDCNPPPPPTPSHTFLFKFIDH